MANFAFVPYPISLYVCRVRLKVPYYVCTSQLGRPHPRKLHPTDEHTESFHNRNFIDHMVHSGGIWLTMIYLFDK